MTPDQQQQALQNVLRDFVTDDPELVGRPQGVLGILKDLATVEAFLAWCMTKGYLAEVPGEAALIALGHLQWREKEDAIQRVWEAEHLEMANKALEPGSAEAIESMIAFVRWKITKRYMDLQPGARVLSSLQRDLERRRFDRRDL
jgi:hypothetical protein